mmetsp:Transcript_77638/g.122515  ORF Transcript_77638/g.122515 Transcript_77638/m.122515 type:complete len:218 (+) Transcript_77638:721-1374(+)
MEVFTLEALQMHRQRPPSSILLDAAQGLRNTPCRCCSPILVRSCNSGPECCCQTCTESGFCVLQVPLLLSIIRCHAVKNRSLVFFCPCLGLLHLHTKSCFCDFHRKASLSGQFRPDAVSRSLCFHLLLILRQAVGDQLRSTTVVHAGAVHHGQIGIDGHGCLVQAPAALEANCLLVNDEQELELTRLHGLVEQCLCGVLTDLALLFQQSACKGPCPV